MLSIRPGLRHDCVATFAEPSAVVAMRTLSPALPTRFAATVAEALQLTPKEARIATLLAAGRSLQEVAASERIGIRDRPHAPQAGVRQDGHAPAELARRPAAGDRAAGPPALTIPTGPVDRPPADRCHSRGTSLEAATSLLTATAASPSVGEKEAVARGLLDAK